MTTTTLSAPLFIRDRFTWMNYLMIAYYAYLQAALGPLMPFLDAELGMNYTVRALHLSLFALGMVIAGLSADRAAARFGRRRVFWGGGAAMALGTLLLVAGQHPAVTIAGAFMMGVTGSYTLIMIQAMVGAHHGERRAYAITEMNVLAAGFATLAPIFVSSAEGSGIGWRWASFAGIGFYAALVFLYRDEPIRDVGVQRVRTLNRPESVRRPLPRLFWLFWIVVLLGVSLEWIMIFWGAEFLETSVGLPKVTASALMTVFFVAMVIGRALGSRLTRAYPTVQLLTGAVALVVIGFPLYWLGQMPALNIAGLFIVGLGIANLYPLALAAAAATVPDQPDRASARISLAAGLAILIAPQILGSVADTTGIGGAFTIAALFVVAAMGITVVANRATR